MASLRSVPGPTPPPRATPTGPPGPGSAGPGSGDEHRGDVHTDPWQRDLLDLDAYLARIGCTGRLAADLPTLTALHRAHLTAIPFENVDLHLGRGISIDLADVQDKLVRRSRGGYCFEQGLLLAAVLERLGFTVERVLARTGDPAVHPRPRSHLVLKVHLDGAVWLADPGFGPGLLEPVPLADGGVHRQGPWRFRVRRGDDGGWRLQEWLADHWETHYTMPDEVTYAVDIADANHARSTSPWSPFVRRIIVIRKDDESIRRLLGREYEIVHPDGSRQVRVVPDSELTGLLAELGVRLTPAESAALVATPPPAGAAPSVTR
jgi:N-hydroxyarylamine O-acetyltransferase